MNPQRIAVKFFTQPDPSSSVDLSPFTPVFHEFIQKASIEGLLIDVADYAHVPNGPGIILIGHDVDYGLDQSEGLAGLLTLRKRYGGAELGDVLRDTLRKALACIAAIEGDGRTGLQFATDALELRILDRREGPNTDEAFASARASAEPVLAELFGEVNIERHGADDPRNLLALRARSESKADVATLLGRLE